MGVTNEAFGRHDGATARCIKTSTATPFVHTLLHTTQRKPAGQAKPNARSVQSVVTERSHQTHVLSCRWHRECGKRKSSFARSRLTKKRSCCGRSVPSFSQQTLRRQVTDSCPPLNSHQQQRFQATYKYIYIYILVNGIISRGRLDLYLSGKQNFQLKGRRQYYCRLLPPHPANDTLHWRPIAELQSFLFGCGVAGISETAGATRCARHTILWEVIDIVYIYTFCVSFPRIVGCCVNNRYAFWFHHYVALS